MSHYAKVENGIVTQVIVAEADFIATGALGDPAAWVQTSYNTHANQHPEGRPLRGNFAGIGYTYDSTNDVFLAPQPFASWTLNPSAWTWESPVAMPTDGNSYAWNEESQSWEESQIVV